MGVIPTFMVREEYRPYLKVYGVQDGQEFYGATDCFNLWENKPLMKRLQMENLDERLSRLQKAEHFSDDVDKPHRLD